DGGDVGRRDVLAVAQNGDAVAGGEDLAHSMGDVDDGEAAGREVADDLEEALDLGDGEGGGGLIEDNDAAPTPPTPTGAVATAVVECAGDLHDLAVTRRERSERGVDVDRRFKFGEQAGGAYAHRPAINEAKPPARQIMQ